MQNLVHAAMTWTLNFVPSIHTSPGGQVLLLLVYALTIQNFHSFLYTRGSPKRGRQLHATVESTITLRCPGRGIRAQPLHAQASALPAKWLRKKQEHKTPPEVQHLTAGFLIAKGWASTASEKTHTPWGNDVTQSVGATVPRKPT